MDSLAGRGPISWQQAARLRNEASYGRYGNLWNRFTVPAWLSDGELHRRLSAIAHREEALWIIDATLDGEGSVGYAPTMAVSLQTERCQSLDEMATRGTEWSKVPFERDGPPLWRVIVFEHPNQVGVTTRTAYTIFDHLVTDGRSMNLLQHELTSRRTSPALRRRGKYRGWVSQQRQEFPSGWPHRSTPAREFWRRYLDGQAPDQPTAVPFAIEPVQTPRGLVTVMNLDVPVSLSALQAAAGRLRTTPFLLVLASTVSAIAADAPVDDLTLRVITAGRPTTHMNAHGWFADSLPLRFRLPALHDFRQALNAAGAAWSQVLEFHYTPWDYIRTACAPYHVSLAEPPGRRQLVVNFVPYEIEGMFTDQPAELTKAGDIDGLHLMLLPLSAGRCQLGCMFNPDHFVAGDTRHFLGSIATRLVELTAG